MSWKPYTDIVKSDSLVKGAAIIGHDGSIWHDDGIGILPTEVAALVAGVKDISKFQASGIVAGTAKYMYLNSIQETELTTVIGRKSSTPIILALTNKAVVVATLKDGANPGNVKQFAFIVKDMKGKTF